MGQALLCRRCFVSQSPEVQNIFVIIMLRIVLACVFLAVVAAQECGTMQRLKVKAQWTAAFGEGDARGDFGLALWKSIFAQAPESRALFTRYLGENNDINSPDFRAHSRRLLGGLDQCISLLDDDATLAAQLAHLNGKHTRWGIPSNYFGVMENALLQVVPAQITRCFDADAWRSCFRVISSGITN